MRPRSFAKASENKLISAKSKNLVAQNPRPAIMIHLNIEITQSAQIEPDFDFTYLIICLLRIKLGRIILS